MVKLVIRKDEAYPVYSWTPAPFYSTSATGTEVELDSETKARWEVAWNLYRAMQEELADLYRRK